MRPFKKRSTLLFPVLLAISCRSSEKAVHYNPVTEKLGVLIEKEIARLNVPALSIALVDGDRIVWKAGFGMQNPDTGTAATAETVYRPASISKLFTAAAVMQLAEQGILDIHAPITRYLPELTFKDSFGSKEQITLRHLMTHRAGILRESPVGNYFDHTDPGIEATVKSIIGSDLVHPVGAVTKYSNLGPTVAGLIIERVTGTPFPEHMQKQLFIPMDMRSSSFMRKGDRIEKNLAKAFMVNFDGTLFPAPYLNLGTLPAGNLYSTAEDLAKFMIMLFAGGKAGGNRILKEETISRMFTIQFPEPGRTADFGLGFKVSKWRGRKRISHAGAVYGFASLFTGLPAEKLGVIVLNTVDCAGGLNRKITDRALELLLNMKYGEPVPSLPEYATRKKIDPCDYTGLYKSKNKTVRVFEKNGALALNVNGPDLTLRPLKAENTFIVDCRLSYGLQVSFLKNSLGKVDRILFGAAQLKRVPSYGTSHEIPAKWKSLVGRYGWPHNIMKIFVRDGKLICLVEWFYEYPMEESGGLTFRFPGYGLYSNETLTFKRDGKGRITGAEMANVFFPFLGPDDS